MKTNLVPVHRVMAQNCGKFTDIVGYRRLANCTSTASAESLVLSKGDGRYAIGGKYVSVRNGQLKYGYSLPRLKKMIEMDELKTK
jgi:hypothetical protein